MTIRPKTDDDRSMTSRIKFCKKYYRYSGGFAMLPSLTFRPWFSVCVTTEVVRSITDVMKHAFPPALVGLWLDYSDV